MATLTVYLVPCTTDVNLHQMGPSLLAHFNGATLAGKSCSLEMVIGSFVARPRAAALATSSTAIDYEIRDIRALVRGRADKAAAQRLLERIAAQVLPILTKRRFRVRRLQEFFPKNANLLGMNVNRGYTIYIRLRPQNRPNSFLPYEALLETMLHELTHMVYGPHNQAFYKYLDELKEETESLIMRGLIGQEGARFQDPGVGMSIQTQTTMIQVRHTNDNRAAVLAAARREKYQRLLGGVTSQRLGTASTSPSTAPDESLTPQQLRARALEGAERRRKDSLVCLLTNGTLANGIEILGIDDGDDESESNAGETSGIQRWREENGVIAIDDDDEEDDVKDEDEDERKPPGLPAAAAADVVELLDDSDDDVEDHPPQTTSGDVVDLTDD